MREYYELSNANGNANTYFVSNPSLQISNAVQELLMQECMASQVSDILMGHYNLNRYIYSHLRELENIYMTELLEEYIRNTSGDIEFLRYFAQEDQPEPYDSENLNSGKHNNWKKDLSYARSIQIMTGYILNFYTPVENLAMKLRNTHLTKAICQLHECTLKLHDNITQISVQLINHKFIN